jgi:hypothetical protein
MYNFFPFEWKSDPNLNQKIDLNMLEFKWAHNKFKWTVGMKNETRFISLMYFTHGL